MKSAIYKENYIVYEDGRVYNIKLNRFISLTNDGQGYYSAKINGKSTKVHRIVAECFIPNPNNKPQVNHIDSNKKNNNLSNLEWVTHSENQRHAWDNGRKLNVIKSTKERKSKIVINIQTGIFYDSAKDAHFQTNYAYSTFKGMLNGQKINNTPFRYI